MGILTVNTDFEKLFGVTEREYYAKQYLTYEMLEDQDAIIYWTAEFINGAAPNLMTQISFSIDDGKTWTDVEIDDKEEYTIHNLKKGDKLLLKGNGGTYNYSSKKYLKIVPNDEITIYGNIMSLIYGDEFYGKNFDANILHSFGYLFAGIITILDAHNLILPTNTVRRCYMHMFEGCAEITTAPELLSTNIAQQAYESMFSGCSKLAYVASPAKGYVGNAGTLNWLKDVAANGTFVSDFNTSWNNGASGIPTGWTKKYFELPTPKYGVGISPDTRNFVGEIEVLLSSGDIKVSGIKYTTDGTEPNVNSSTYNVSFVLTDTTTIKAASFNTDGEEYKFGPTSSATFTKVTPSLFAYVDKFPAYKDVDDPDYDNDTDLDYINFFDMTRSEFIAAVAADPEQYKSDKYYYAGDTIEYDGVIYNVWGYMNDPDKAEWMFMWTTTADYSTLNQQSIATSGENAEFTALYTFYSNGTEPGYNNADVNVPRQLVKIVQAS